MDGYKDREHPGELNDDPYLEWVAMMEMEAIDREEREETEAA